MRKITATATQKFFNQTNFKNTASNIAIKSDDETTIFKLYTTTIAILTDNLSETKLTITYWNYSTNTTLEKIRGILETIPEFYPTKKIFTIRTIKWTIFLIEYNTATAETTKHIFNNVLTIDLKNDIVII